MRYNTLAASDAKEKKRLEAKHNAMIKRLESLPDDNLVVEAALKDEEMDDKRDERYQKWEPCQELVSAASSEYMDGNISLKKALKNLGEALVALSEKS